MILRLDQPSRGGFLLLGGLVAGIYLLRGGTRYLYGLSSHIAAYRTLHRMMGRVFAHLQRQPPSFLHATHSGELVARSVGDVQEIEDFIAHGIPETMLAIVIPLTMSVVLFILNWQLALIALLPLPIAAVLSYLLTRRVRNYWVGVRRRFAGLSATMQDHLSGLPTVQSFTAEKESAAKIERESRQYRDSIIHANRWSLMPAGIVETASGGGLVLLICAGAWMTGADSRLNVDVADLVVFVMYLGQIFTPFLRLANLTEQLQKSAASAERVFELLDTQPEITDSANAAVPATPAFDIVFDRVQFAYGSNPAVLNGASFEIAAGETVAVAGVTGVGKTTLCHLLLRFYDVNAGEIRLGGHDIRQLPLQYLRSQIAFVSQDVFLFQGTIRENLLLGNPAATDDELHAAAEAAHCLEFIESFPDGFETIVGERGVRLSGGQKQRVAIARALLKDAPVLVLDEATSAVDSETEAVIREALGHAFAGRTVLIVAHRLSTIQAADRIVVLDGGRVVETGTYDELTTADSHFARLCRVQENAIW
ncbi:MAG: ABC transporter ATP-binding protein [Planctomycetes bacterium]|nr:ABC transporter ATP-binding protein [Planctomycetota bacterium]